MVAALAAEVGEDVPRDVGAAAEAVVKVDAGAWSVVRDISLDGVAKRLGLEVEGVLLGPQPHLVHEVGAHLRAARLAAARRVVPHPRDLRRVRVRVRAGGVRGVAPSELRVNLGRDSQGRRG